MSSSNIAPAKKQTFSVAITTENYRNLINNTLKEPGRANRFIASITSAVAITPALQTCDPGSILAGGLLGEALNLSPSPQLGQYYLVPFKQKAKYDREGHLLSPECSKAQFVLGYKGYIQLALRSGQYRKLGCMEIRQGEYLGKDPETAEPRFRFIEDDDLRERLPIVGYMAHFEYLNGFRKRIYWSREKVLNHADTYSQAFSKEAYDKIQNGQIADKDMWKYSSFWYLHDDTAKTQPENYLKNAEMALEDDYGMIDGIINNGPKQTVAEQEERSSILAKLKAPVETTNRTEKHAPKRSAEKEL